MKKLSYISVVAALLAGCTFTSCSDFLEADNKSAGGQTAEEFFSANPSYMLTSSFATLKSIANQVEIYEAGTDLYINTRGHAAGEFGSYSLSSSNSTVESLYKNCYKAINYANGVIKFAGSDTNNAYQARFIRNYCYYLLSQHFGAVPYITSYIETANTDYPRTDLNTLYTSMISDLEDLYNNSSLDAKSAHDGYVTKQAVAALLAKVNLAAGWDLNTTLTNAEAGTYSVTGTSYFTKAAEYAEKAIDGVTLYTSFNDKWLPSNDASNQEEIWSILYQKDGYPGDVSEGGHDLQYTYGGYPTGTDKAGLKYVNSDYQQSEKSMNLFEKGDSRYEGTFMTTFYDGSTISDGYYAYYNNADPNTHKINARWFPSYMTEAECQAELEAHLSQYLDLNSANSFKAALLQTPNVTVWTISGGKLSKSTLTLTQFNAAINNGTCVKKFDDPTSSYSTKDQDYRNIVIFHASDMYLVAAEAYLMSGKTADYWTKINAVRNRAGLASLSSVSNYDPLYSISTKFGNTTELDLLLDERARELYAERTRWEDLRRTRQLVRYNIEFNESVGSVSDMSNNKGEVKWYRPIPDNEISYNSGITVADQNPGY